MFEVEKDTNSFLIRIRKYHEAIESSQNEAYKSFQEGQYDKSVSWYSDVECLLQDLKNEYNIDIQKYAEFYLIRSRAKIYIGDTNGANEDLEKYKQITR